MSHQTGFSLPELLIVIAVLAIALGITALYLEPLGSPIESGVTLVDGFLRDLRVTAIASTRAVRIRPFGKDTLIAERADSCGSSTWLDAGRSIELPTGVTMLATDWAVCFTSRGISSDNVKIVLDHARYTPRSIEVLVGGTTKVHR